MLPWDKDEFLEDFLDIHTAQQLRQTDAAVRGSPLVLIIAASAITANDIVKKLPGLNKVLSASKS